MLPDSTRPPRHVCIYPDPIGPIPIGGGIPDTYSWYAAASPGAAREGVTVIRPTGGLGEISPDPAAPGGGSPPSLRDVLHGLGVFGPPARPSAPADPYALPRDSMSDLSGGGTDMGGVILNFRYGDIAFKLPTTWLNDYVANNRQSPRSDALDLLWTRYLIRDTPSSDTARRLLSCWSVPTVPTNGVVWNSFWPDGGPWNVFEHLIRLIYAFREYARDSFSGTDWCDGLSDFLEGALQGRATPTQRDRSCEDGVRFFVTSVDSRYTDMEPETCVGSQDVNCGAGHEEDGAACGDKADAWQLRWDDENYAWQFQLPGGGAATSHAAGGCGASASGGSLAVWIHGAIQLGTEGFLVDWLLWWARAALDYGMEHPSRQGHLDAASLLARFALTRLVEFGQLIIHELGHVYIDRGGHCSRGCCMSTAAVAWSCHVTAYLGLSVQTAYPRYGAYSSLARSCGHGDYSNRCSINEVGAVGGLYVFESEGTGC